MQFVHDVIIRRFGQKEEDLNMRKLIKKNKINLKELYENCSRCNKREKLLSTLLAHVIASPQQPAGKSTFVALVCQIK